MIETNQLHDYIECKLATIAELRAEIEQLKRENEALHESYVQNTALLAGEIERLRAERKGQA